jgi:hypothetical protein
VRIAVVGEELFEATRSITISMELGRTFSSGYVDSQAYNGTNRPKWFALAYIMKT